MPSARRARSIYRRHDKNNSIQIHILKAIKYALAALVLAAIPVFAAEKKLTKACEKCCKDAAGCKECCKDAKAPCGTNCCKAKKKDK